MFQKIIPYCYFPTQVVVLDDNQSFVNSLMLAIGKTFNSIGFTIADEALKYLNQQADYIKKPVDLYFLNDDQIPATVNVQININLLLSEMLKKDDRFDYPVVILVDYSMPSMDGLTFCEALQDIPYQKILLTGEADNDFAVNAFNQGKIEKFIKKGEENYIKKLKSHIQSCTVDYFCRFSETLSDFLKVNNYDLFRKKRFINYFNKLISEYNIVEFYLLDDIGSYLLVDNKGEKITFVIKTEAEMQHFVELAHNDESPNALNTANLIKERKKVPYLFTWEDNLKSVDQWQLHDASILQIEDCTYYYALVKLSEIETSDSQKKNITSTMLTYADYLSAK